MLKVQKGDLVAVATGKDKGKRGKVMHIFPSRMRAVVEGINVIKKHQRRTRQDQQKAGIIEMESPLALSKLMVVCKNCDAGVRVGFSILKDKTKVRICKKCSEVI